MNKGPQAESNEEFIKELTILKIKKYLGSITDVQYREGVIDLNIEYSFSDFIESASKNAFEIIVSKIELIENTNDLKILFNEEVEVQYDTYSLKRNCDILLITRDFIEVIRILPLENNKIYAFESLEIKLLAVATIDKFLAAVNTDVIRLTIVQPNLMSLSVYECGIVDLLHEVEYSVL